MPRVPKEIGEQDFAAILEVVKRYPGGASRVDIARGLPQEVRPRTLQFRLKSLVEAGRLVPAGEGRAAKYLLPESPAAPETAAAKPVETAAVVPISAAGAMIQHQLSQPVAARKPVGYSREFLDGYRSNLERGMSRRKLREPTPSRF